MIRMQFIAALLLVSFTAFAGTSQDLGYVSTTLIGQPNGVASLDGTGKVPISQIPGGGISATWGSINGTLSNQTDLQSALNGKQASLGFTPENVANKSTDGTLAANSDTLYPSQKAVKTYADTKQSALTPGTLSTSTSGVNVGNGASSTVGPNVTVNVATASGSQNGLLSSADWTTFNNKQNAFAGTTLQYVRGDASLATLNTTVVPEGSNLYFTNARAQGAVSASAPLVDAAGVFSIPAATNSVDGYLTAADHTTFSAKQATVVPGHDLWVDRNGSDSNNCSIAAPCQTVGFALTLVTSPSSTNNWTVHLLSGRHDQETNDLLMPPYTWIVGNGGPDVGSYLRLPSGKAIKASSGWTVNARGGLQSIYLGGGTSVNLDFAGIGGSAGSNFMLDDVFVTGSLTHTGRGVNGGDFLYVQNSFIFGAASLTGSELQSLNSTWGSTVTAATGTSVPSDLTFFGGQVTGAFSFTQGNGQTATLGTSGTTYAGSFTTTGTIALKADLNLPIGYSLSGGTTRTNLTNAKSVPYTPAVSGNWSPVPTEVSGALDQLAANAAVAGNVTGPGSSVNNDVVFFNGTTGKIIKDSGLTLSGSNTGDVTIGTANGLSLSGQALSLALASTSTTGALSSTDWNTFNGKFNLPSFTAGSVIYSDGTTLIQDNTNFFFDNTNHSLSVGPGPHPATSADLAITSQSSDTKVGLSVFDTGSNNAVQIQNQSGFSLAAEVADATNSPSINFERARGTLASKTQAKAGDILGSFVFNGYTGTADGPFAAGFGAVALEDQAAGHGGAEILFQTTPIGSGTLATRMVLDSAGKVQIPGLTASRAIVTDASSNLAVAATTATEIGYVSGVTSAIQTQLNTKQNRVLAVTNGGNTAYTILSTDDEVRTGTTLTADRAYTLPACASGNVGEYHIVKNPPAQTFNITLTAAGSDLIDGNATMTIYPGQSLTVVCGAAAVWDIN